MKANVIVSDDPALASSFINGVSSFTNEARDYLSEAHNSFVNKTVNLGQNMMSRINQTFDYFNNNIKINNIMDNLRQTEALNGDSNIYTINKNNYQNTGYQMRRYIMVNPEINRLESRNRITGYNNQWFNNEPDIPIKYNSDYYKAIDGVYRCDETGGSYITYSTSDSNRLTLSEKMSILESWDFVLENLSSNDRLDVTDI